MDDLIQDLARLHGYETLSGEQIKSVREKLAEAFVDDVLDAAVKASDKTS